MAVGLTVLALTVLSFAVARVAAINGCRLARIVAPSVPGYLGFLELPGGGQALMPQGGAISGGWRRSRDAHLPVARGQRYDAVHPEIAVTGTITVSVNPANGACMRCTVTRSGASSSV